MRLENYARQSPDISVEMCFIRGNIVVIYNGVQWGNN